MTNPELLGYVRTALEGGRSVEDCRRDLLSAGWKEEDVDESIGMVSAKKTTKGFSWRTGVFRSATVSLVVAFTFFISTYLMPRIDFFFVAGATIILFFAWGAHAFSAPPSWGIVKFFKGAYSLSIGGIFLSLYVQVGPHGRELDLLWVMFGMPLVFGLVAGGLLVYLKRNYSSCVKHFPGSRMSRWSGVVYYVYIVLLVLGLFLFTKLLP